MAHATPRRRLAWSAAGLCTLLLQPRE